MTVPIDRAAADLLREIGAPPGAVNTIGISGPAQTIIRVLVDESFWYRIRTIPRTFEGFEVCVEKRGLIDLS